MIASVGVCACVCERAIEQAREHEESERNERNIAFAQTVIKNRCQSIYITADDKSTANKKRTKYAQRVLGRGRARARHMESSEIDLPRFSTEN